MNNIDLIKNNSYLKTLYPNGLSNLIVNFIRLNKDLNVEVELITSKSTSQEIDIPYNWGKKHNSYYVAIKLELVNPSIEYKNTDNLLYFEFGETSISKDLDGELVIEKKENKMLILVNESFKKTKIECDKIICMGIIIKDKEKLKSIGKY